MSELDKVCGPLVWKSICEVARILLDRFPIPLKILRCSLLSLAVIAALAAFSVILVWKDLLMVAADLWQVDRRVVSADAVFVPGGGAHFRPYVAARLFHRGVVSKVLVSDVKLTPGDKLGLTEPEVRRTTDLLRFLGVDTNSIEVIGQQVDSTYAEAHALRDWMTDNDARRVIVPTDGFHSRRMDWIMQKYAGGQRREICIWACVTPYFDIETWWKNEYGVVGFQNEILKYLVYRIKY